MDMTPQAWPDWYDGRHINEVLFCQQFLDKHPMKCVRGRLFTVDGLIEDEGQIGNLILEEISGVLTSGLSKVVTNLLASIKLQAYSPPLPIEADRIHVANGTYFIDGTFTADKSYCNNRLTVAYNPDAPVHARFMEACHKLDETEYYLDILCVGDSHERAEVVQQQMVDGKLDRLRRRLEKIHKEDENDNDTANVA